MTENTVLLENLMGENIHLTRFVGKVDKSKSMITYETTSRPVNRKSLSFNIASGSKAGTIM